MTDQHVLLTVGGALFVAGCVMVAVYIWWIPRISGGKNRITTADYVAAALQEQNYRVLAMLMFNPLTLLFVAVAFLIPGVALEWALQRPYGVLKMLGFVAPCLIIGIGLDVLMLIDGIRNGEAHKAGRQGDTTWGYEPKKEE